MYLADDVGRQVKQGKGVSFVPGVQHTEEMGNVVCAVRYALEEKILPSKSNNYNIGIITSPSFLRTVKYYAVYVCVTLGLSAALLTLDRAAPFCYAV